MPCFAEGRFTEGCLPLKTCHFVRPKPLKLRLSCVQIEAESELQSLQARLDDMTEKYSRAVAEQETAVDSAPALEERVRQNLNFVYNLSGISMSFDKSSS